MKLSARKHAGGFTLVEIMIVVTIIGLLLLIAIPNFFKNREIAQSLYVTAKTVETHLRHCYQKLDITGRRELEQALAA